MTADVDRSLRVAPTTPGVERTRVRANLMAKLFGAELATLRIGRFKVNRRVGGGAQGDVYEAQDPGLERTVAVKVLRRSGRLAAREGRALARLAHPNVVEVFGRGEYTDADGALVEYVVTEFVPGEPLPEWLERNPDPKARVGVLLGCARGLQGAHEAGIVHGDFKPSNVMVRDGPRAQIIDFGIASDLEDLQRTPLRVEGTAGYIAPERYEGSIQPAIDQFSFCVVAHEVLGGAGISGRLMAALERGRSSAPRDRFATLEPLIDLLQRELQPRRWRWAVVGAAVVACVVAGLLRADASLPCDAVTAERRDVWTPARRATFVSHPDAAAITSMSDRWVRDWDVARIDACERGPRAAAVTRCLDGLLVDFDLRLGFADGEIHRGRVAGALAALPVASACATESKSENSISEVDEGKLRQARAAGDLEGPAAGLRDSDDLAARVEGLPARFGARVLRHRARWASQLQRNEDAVRWYEASVWKADEAGDDAAAARGACSASSLAGGRLGDLHRAEAWLRRAKAFAQRTPGGTDECVVRAEAALARERGEFSRARRLLETASATARGWAATQISVQRCTLEESAGNPVQAVQRCTEAVDAFAETLGPDHPRTIQRRQSLGAALEGAGRWDEAREVLENALAAQERRGGANLYWTLNSLGIVLEQLEEFEQAKAVYERALDELEAAPNGRPESRESLEINLGTLALVQDDLPESEQHYRRALIAMQTRLGSDHPRILSARWGLAEVLFKQERAEDALEQIEEALRIGRENAVGAGLLVKPRLVKARILIKGGLDLEEGRAAAQQVLDDVQKFAPELSETSAEARTLLDLAG